MDDTTLREHLARVLAWEDAHVDFETAVADFPRALRGATPEAQPWSAWQLLEHLRLAQHDILDFCRNPAYREMKWPDDYWPASPMPPSDAAWEDAIAGYLADRRAVQALAADTAIDLGARIPHGSGQTYLRELLLVADHNAYHVGQLVLVRRFLGIWPAR
jgi:uncharacterized damage-inducible protein DinB